MKKLIGLIEISLLILSSFAFSYIIGEFDLGSKDFEIRESKTVGFVREKALEYLSGGLVSAQEALYTCIEDNQGAFCQEYSSSECNDLCSSSCIPTNRDNTLECKVGTCYNGQSGICDSGTPKVVCENAGGQWFEGIPSQCNRNCCLINPDGNGGGDQAQYATEQQCNSLGFQVGTSVSWEPVSNELECLALSNSAVEGACVLEYLEEDSAYNCEIRTQSNCLNSGGDFHEGKLCTSPGLNTICQTTQETKCFLDEDAVYFVDSCGNKANIYDSSKINDNNYWDNIVSKEDSCSLDSIGNPLGNQASCGTCDFLQGSVCGTPGSIDNSPNYGDYVCKDLRCTDYKGDIRENGESWCRFDSAIGVDGESGKDSERSVDVPGSRSYRQVCFNGEIRLDPCQDYRNEVCVESSDNSADFSSAICRVNNWQTCLDANSNQEKLNSCEENSGCFLKTLDVDDYFKFDLCVPKYPPGLDLNTEGSSKAAEAICSYGSQSCTYIERKSATGKWNCVENCDCKSGEFAEDMNNLCISLGDCGGNINLAGEYSGDGYSVSRGAKVSSQYIENLKKYKDPVEGQSADPYTAEEIAALLEIPVSEGLPPTVGEITSKILGIGGLGVAGGVIIYALATTPASLSYIVTTATLTEAQTAIGGGLVGAASIGVGAFVGLIVGYAFGLEGDGLTLAVFGGALGGGLAGFGVFSNTVTLLGIFAWAAVFAAVFAAVALILGIGKTREKTVSFECKPWQAPTGGENCNLCNDDLVCSKYKCESYGQSCELLNEGTSEQSCTNINPNDFSAPQIKELDSAIGEDYIYKNVQNNGFKVELNSGDGCIKEYTPVEFGIETNEPAQCKYDFEHTASYDEMHDFFGKSNLYINNHSALMAMPLLDELGVTGITPDRRGDYNLYIRCQDKNGNSNSAEYAINFCVAPAEDITAPQIKEFIPENPGYASLNKTNFDLSFYTNEPANCKWSTSDLDYSLMNENTVCLNDFEQVTEKGWLCAVTLPVSNLEENNYYFICEDQPWLGTNETGRNHNNQGVNYKIIRTQTGLEITNVKPNGTTIYSGSIPVSVDLELETLGGVDNTGTCEYSFGGNYVPFFNSGGQTHKQTFTSLIEGSYEIDLKCEDVAGNVANSLAKFDIKVDNNGPEISRIYDSSGSLNIITNEYSTCYYSYDSCSFGLENGNLMSGSNYIHSTSFDRSLTYRIKCQDTFGNVGQCLSVSGGY